MLIWGTKVISSRQRINTPIIGRIFFEIYGTERPVMPEATKRFAP